MVVLEGLLNVPKVSNTIMAQLPAGYRPQKRLLFSCNSHAETVRVDVTPGGDVLYVGGTRSQAYISVSGIVFHV
jgi:hypothetical protein